MSLARTITEQLERASWIRRLFEEGTRLKAERGAENVCDYDIAFVRLLVSEGVLGVPGAGFGRSGYFRLSLTAPMETIERSLPCFERALARAVPVAAHQTEKP